MNPQIRVELLLAEDPTFQSGSSHSAVAQLSNPTIKEFTYTTELYLGVTKAATSGIGSVTIAAGASASVNYPVIMPIPEGDYDVYLDVWVGTELIAHYKATEKVTIEVSPAVEIGIITWV